MKPGYGGEKVNWDGRKGEEEEEGNSSFMRGVLNFPSVTGHRSTGGATTTAGSSIRGGVQAREGGTGMDGYRGVYRGRRKRERRERGAANACLGSVSNGIPRVSTSYSP